MPSIQVSRVVAGLQEAGWLAGDADAARRAGEDDVTGQQGQDGGELGDEPGDAEDEVAGAGVLQLLAVDRAAEGEVVGVVQLVGGDDPGPDGAVAAAGLADGELRAGRELEVPVADVLADREAGDVGPGVGLVDSVGGAADDDDELDLPVGGVADDFDVVEGPGEAGRELREHDRDLGQGHAGLLGVAAVVEADGEHLAGSRHRVAQVGLDEGAGPGGDGGGEVPEGVPLVVEPHGVGTEATVGGGGDVGDLVTEDERGAAVEVGKLHRMAPSRAGWISSRVRRWSMRAAAAAGDAAVP